ncbi:MAG: peptidyl-prolyl cis-trans isomerase [Gammaproteobacteria bacterium]|nr:peptidyl-prolyl cis-trans isomerase [Gammaproteobacteria bacterium]MBU0850585.1 peptidyl-prolyl cis-trans isomerase [Gammaproteobacteria bacterium]MBU1268379.1 peptidyl-prolyl cis-trans isomerase [Gammaproteobacteria bacterium]MBU1530223.1 peptidyl-prolyl cis-trans isomerase [Gammaproteobacteria bacterium]MBU1780597.1 peptidyl-prolyl cis-trans isomerase [Gammaproteobacteria bacterium]
MKPSHSALGFLAVAALIGILEWNSAEQAAANTLQITNAQRAFVREQVLQTGVQVDVETSFDQAMGAYIDDEILYREGLKLGLEKDDLIVKRRVVQKMRFLLEDMTPIAPPTHAQLQAWLEKNSQRYQTGQAVSFEHHFFSRGKRGDEALFHARNARPALLAGGSIESDPFPLAGSGVATHKDQLVKELGLPVGNAVFELPENEWSAPVQSSMGVHLFKVTARNEGRTMSVQEAGGQLLSDLIAAQRDAVNKAGMAALRASYTILETP